MQITHLLREPFCQMLYIIVRKPLAALHRAAGEPLRHASNKGGRTRSSSTDLIILYVRSVSVGAQLCSGRTLNIIRAHFFHMFVFHIFIFHVFVSQCSCSMFSFLMFQNVLIFHVLMLSCSMFSFFRFSFAMLSWFVFSFSKKLQRRANHPKKPSLNSMFT